MPYLRLTADRRGFENTFLLHVAAPGEPARVLYWYRTAPGLRIGRPALDDSAMRSLEAQYPDIDFDWPYILEMGSMTPVEVEAPAPVRKRKPRPAEADADEDRGAPPPLVPAAATAESSDGHADPAAASVDALPPPPGPDPDLLSDLLGRGIAASLRGRHRELADEVAAYAWPDADTAAAMMARVRAVDPDGWATPEAVLAGMARIDDEVEALRALLSQPG